MSRIGALIAAALLALGLWGTWSYARDFYRYRGFPPPRDPPGVARGHLVHQQFASAALGRRAGVYVYLPPGYGPLAAAGRRFGVLYLLHGAPSQPLTFLDAGNAGVALDVGVARRELGRMILVIPDGRDGTLKGLTEWANTPHGRYEDFVLDAVRAVDHRWATVPDRRHRVLAGISEGAFGAVNVGLRHLGTFGGIQSWSGYFRQTATGPFDGASPALLRANSPSDYVPTLAPRLRRLALHAYLYGGAQDPNTRHLGAFAAELRRAGARVRVRVWPGRHDWRLWRARTPLMLRVAGSWMGARP